MEQKFIVTTDGELQRRGYTAANRPTIVLDPARVPPALRSLIPLAEKWGIPDDAIRDEVFRLSDPADLRDLIKAVRENEDLIDEWLAGAEGSLESPSLEYGAFSAMCIGVDCL